MRKIWYGIQNSDLTAAILACKNGDAPATVPDGDYVAVARATDNHNGSGTVIQVCANDAELDEEDWSVMDDSHDIGSLQTQTNQYGTRQYRVITSTRYIKFRNGFNSCLTAMKNEPNGTEYISRPGTPQSYRDGVWVITFDTFDPEDGMGEWTDET